MTKKNKLILWWSIPTLTVAVAAGVSLPTIIFLDSEKREILNYSKNYYPVPFNLMSSAAQNNLTFNPKDYDFNFFWQNICQSPFVNSVFEFQGLTYDSIENVWKSDQGVIYTIDSIELLNSDDTNYTFRVKVKKTYNDVSSTPYVINSLQIPKSAFATTEESKQNFVTYSAEIINNLFLNNNLQVVSTKDLATSVSDFTSPSDVNIKSNNISNASNDNNQLASSFFKNETTNLYMTNNDVFKYDYNLGIYSSFSIPVSNNVWSSSEYDIDANGLITDQSAIYNFLVSEYNNGHLTYLPELTTKEKEEVQKLQKEITNYSSDTISVEIQKRIQKLIFNPNYTPFSYNENNLLVPLSNLQAIAIKVQLDNNSYTWLITWTNLLSISPNLVLNAAELQMMPILKNNQELTYEEIQNPLNYDYFETTSKPSNGLVYKVIDVSFAEDDIYKLNANLTIQISHPEIESTKEYDISISSGFQSKAYVDLYNQVKNITNNFENMDSAKPTINAKDNVTKDDVLKNYSNINWLKENLIFTAPSGITSAEYSVNWVLLSNDATKLLFSFSIASINDPNSFIKYNLVEQEILAEFIIPSTRMENQTESSFKKNKIVFLDS